MRIRQIGRAGGYGIMAALLIWVALSIPVHFRSVSPLILSEAGEGTRNAEDLAGELVDAGSVGPAALVLQTVQGSREANDLKSQIARILAEKPAYRLSGGPSPYYEAWIEAAGIDLPASGKDLDALSLLLPGANRRELMNHLESSSNATVSKLLLTRVLNGYEELLPISSGAGQPLEATILLTALLEEGDHWQASVSRELLAAADTAPEDITTLEEAYLAVLALATRTNWGQLSALIETVPSLEALASLHAATQLSEDQFPQLYTACLLTEDPEAVADYLLDRGEEGWADLDLTVIMGEGAVLAMLDFFQPLYHAPAYLQFSALQRSQEALQSPTEQQPVAALIVKTLCLLLGGFCLTLALIALLRGALFPTAATPKGHLSDLFHLIMGAGLAAFIWILSEPALLQFAPNENGQLRIQTGNLLPEGLDATTISTMLDQVTILVLLIFLVLQGTVFVFGLLKIREIRLHKAAPSLKLQLLDNEENLFDLGLYVGLGGTVSSLVMVVLQFIDASLMAAYASTLFGIVFVAVLKIGFLRPFRRKLILEADARAPQS